MRFKNDGCGEESFKGCSLGIGSVLSRSILRDFFITDLELVEIVLRTRCGGKLRMLEAQFISNISTSLYRVVVLLCRGAPLSN